MVLYLTVTTTKILSLWSLQSSEERRIIYTLIEVHIHKILCIIINNNIIMYYVILVSAMKENKEDKGFWIG